MKKGEILKFYQNYRLYLFPAIVVLSSLILIIFVIYPQTAKLITNRKVEREMAAKSKFLEAKAQTLDNLDSTDLDRKVNFALGFLPTDKDFISALGLLQSLSSQSGFNAISISLGSSSSKDVNVQSYSLKLDILGPIKLLPILLGNIESSPRLMRVSSVDTTPGKDPQGAIVFLNVDVLYSSVPEGFGSIDSPLPELSKEDDEVIAKLAKVGTAVAVAQPQITVQLGPRGRANPFE